MERWDICSYPLEQLKEVKAWTLKYETYKQLQTDR